MAEKVVLVDDMTGESGDDLGIERIQITVAGKEFDGDFSRENTRKLLTTIAPWLRAMRHTGRLPDKLRGFGIEPDVASRPTGMASSPSGNRRRALGSETYPEVLDEPRKHSPEERTKLNAWCEENGIDISPGGRVASLLWFAWRKNDPEIWKQFADAA